MLLRQENLELLRPVFLGESSENRKAEFSLSDLKADLFQIPKTLQQSLEVPYFD